MVQTEAKPASRAQYAYRAVAGAAESQRDHRRLEQLSAYALPSEHRDIGRWRAYVEQASNPGDNGVASGLLSRITQATDGMFVAVWQQVLPDGGRDIRWARFTREWVLGL